MLNIFSSPKKGDSKFQDVYDDSSKKIISSGNFPVYKVIHKATNEVRAVKFIPKGKFNDEELSIMTEIKHINLVKFYECIEEDFNYFIVMEYCEDGDLHNYLYNLKKDESLDTSLIIDWSKQLIEGLKYLNERKIMHRDIKPKNIFIKNQTLLKLGNFALSNQLQETTIHASTVGIETVNYMSPELFGEEKYDFKCDIWALGITIYEMIKKSCPCINEIEIKTKDYPPLKLNNYLHELLLNHFIKELLTKDSSKRPCINKVSQNIKSVVSIAIDSNDKDQYGKSQIHNACELGSKEIVEYLLSKGANVNDNDQYTKKPIHYACESGSKELVEYLLSQGANVNENSFNNEKPIHYACESGSKELVEYLLSQGANVNENGYFNNKPIYYASSSGNKELVEYLLSKGANVNKKGIYIRNPLFNATSRRRNAMVEKYLLEC